ncbi:MAG: hypothetical protein P8130_14165 [Deltaproteobacteria bacterium]
MRTRNIFATVLGLAVIVAAVGGAWYLQHQRQTKICPFSGRATHLKTRAFVTIGGQEYETCCVRCAIIEAQQTGKPFRILKVADFETRKLLNPTSAWFVEGSTVDLCARMAPETKSPDDEDIYVCDFDRSSPSILAFSSEKHARAFIASHGGAAKRLDDLEREATSSRPKDSKP